jgi:lysozyme
MEIAMKTPQEIKLETFIDSLGLKHFKGKELTPYWRRVRKGVSNSCPPEDLWPNIVPTLVVLDKLRHILGAAITLTSTYRSPAYNSAVGGERMSYHMKFMAIDFQGGQTSVINARAARSLRGSKFRNPHTGKTFAFAGGIGQYASFVHIDTRGINANW